MKKICKILAGALIFLCTILTGLGVCNGILSITFDDTGDAVIVTHENLDPTIFQNIQVTSGFQQSGAPYVTDSSRPLVEFGRITFFVANGDKPATFYGPISEFPLSVPAQISDILNIVHTSGTMGNATGTIYDYFLESDYLGASPQPIPGFTELFEGVDGNSGTEDNTPNLPNGILALHVLSDVDSPDVEPVPEPATMFLLGSGLLGLAGFGRKRFFNK